MTNTCIFTFVGKLFGEKTDNISINLGPFHICRLRIDEDIVQSYLHDQPSVSPVCKMVQYKMINLTQLCPKKRERHSITEESQFQDHKMNGTLPLSRVSIKSLSMIYAGFTHHHRLHTPRETLRTSS